jgi:hypothetical protein
VYSIASFSLDLIVDVIHMLCCMILHCCPSSSRIPNFMLLLIIHLVDLLLYFYFLQPSWIPYLSLLLCKLFAFFSRLHLHAAIFLLSLIIPPENIHHMFPKFIPSNVQSCIQLIHITDASCLLQIFTKMFLIATISLSPYLFMSSTS